MIKRIIYAESVLISVLLGIHWHSWWVSGGVLLGLLTLTSVQELIVVFSLLASVFWFLIIGQIFSQWGGEPAFVVTGIMTFFVSCGLHSKLVKESRMDKPFFREYFAGNIPGAEQINKITGKMKEYVKNVDQSIKEGKPDSKSAHINPFTKDPDQRNYGKEYNIYDDSTGHPDDDD